MTSKTTTKTTTATTTKTAAEKAKPAAAKKTAAATPAAPKTPPQAKVKKDVVEATPIVETLVQVPDNEEVEVTASVEPVEAAPVVETAPVIEAVEAVDLSAYSVDELTGALFTGDFRAMTFRVVAPHIKKLVEAGLCKAEELEGKDNRAFAVIIHDSESHMTVNVARFHEFVGDEGKFKTVTRISNPMFGNASPALAMELSNSLAFAAEAASNIEKDLSHEVMAKFVTEIIEIRRKGISDLEERYTASIFRAALGGLANIMRQPGLSSPGSLTVNHSTPPKRTDIVRNERTMWMAAYMMVEEGWDKGYLGEQDEEDILAIKMYGEQATDRTKLHQRVSDEFVQSWRDKAAPHFEAIAQRGRVSFSSEFLTSAYAKMVKAVQAEASINAIEAVAAQDVQREKDDAEALAIKMANYKPRKPRKSKLDAAGEGDEGEEQGGEANAIPTLSAVPPETSAQFVD